MYEITLYDLAGHPQEPRQVVDVVREAGGVSLRTGEFNGGITFDLFIPYHRVYEIRRLP